MKTTVVVLTIRRGKRTIGREAGLLKNEHVTLSGEHPTRYDELRAAYAHDARVSVERTEQNHWPEWAAPKTSKTKTGKGKERGLD